MLTFFGIWLWPEATAQPWARWLALTGVLLGGYSFWRTEQAWPRPVVPVLPRMDVVRWRRWLGRALLWAGVMLVGWTLWRIWHEPFAWTQGKWWAAGVLTMLAGAWLLTGRAVQVPPSRATQVDAVSRRHKLGVARVQQEGGASTLSGLTRLPHLQKTTAWPGWLEGLLLVLVLSVAIWFRLHRIHQMPPGLFIDETNAALDALHTLEGRADSLFGTGWFETPNGFVYWQTLFFRLLGTTFAAIKLQSVLPGVLTVLALYFLGRALYGPGPALVASFLLAVNRWHVTMSRWGWNEVYPPLMQVLALWFIMRGARRRAPVDWALAGVLLGVGMYTYLAIRMAALVIFAYLGYRTLVERAFLRRNWQGLALFLLFYAATFAPLGITYAKNPFTFLNRSQQVSILNDIKQADSWQPLTQSVQRHAAMFWVEGDHNPRHNLPGKPMLDGITGALFALGAAWALWRWRDHRRGLMLLWLGITLLGGILSRLDEAPQAYRTLAVTPAVALLAADAWAWLWRALALPGRDGRVWRRAAGLLMGLALLAAGWINYQVYFQEQAHSQAVYLAFTPLENAVAQDVLARRDTEQLFLSPRLYYFSPVRFLTYRPTHPVGVKLGPFFYSPFARLGGGLAAPGYAVAEPASDLPLPDEGRGATFLLDLEYQYLLDYFLSFYPHARGQVVMNRLNDPMYFRVSIPAEDVAAAAGQENAGHGLLAEYFHGETWQGKPFLRRVDPFLLFAWPEQRPVPGPFSVRWTGQLLAPQSGDYLLRLEADDGVRLLLDGVLLGEALVPDQPNTLELHHYLNAGPHDIEIDYFQRGGGKAMNFYWLPPGQPLQPVGPQFLQPASNSDET